MKTHFFESKPVHQAFDAWTSEGVIDHRTLLESYSYGVGKKSFNQKSLINLLDENRAVHEYLSYLKTTRQEIQLFVVPGFVPPMVGQVKLHWVAKMRLNSVVNEMNKNSGAMIFLTGGNVKPKNTPYNEAYEMKKHLMEFHKVPEYLIAIDPNAQNTVTNFRNTGRFMLAFNFTESTVVTTLIQNIYLCFAGTLGLHRRSHRYLGYKTGEFECTALGQSLFRPSSKVMEKTPSLIDP